jgi:two-component sensor histidine kinase
LEKEEKEILEQPTAIFIERIEALEQKFSNDSVEELQARINAIDSKPEEVIAARNVLQLAEVQGKLTALQSTSDFYQNRFLRLLQKETQLTILNSLAFSLMGKNTVEEAINSIPENTFSLLDIHDCIIFMFDDKREYLIQKGVFLSKGSKLEGFKVKLGEGILGHVAATGIPEIVSDTTNDSRYITYEIRGLSELSVPIIADGKVVGVIDAENPEKDYFTQEHLSLLSSIANILSPRILQANTQQKLIDSKSNLEHAVKDRTLELEKAVSELQQSNKEITKQKDERGVLLKEIHHRVKNNLQIINSLIRLQSRNISDEAVNKLFEECQNRIISMSLIHEQLYEANDLTSINIQKYIELLTEKLIKTYEVDTDISLQLDIIKNKFDLNTLIPIGLILNELISNSIKHAFQQRERGLINVILIEANKNSFILTVTDDGVGFSSEEFQKEDSETLGIELIKSLVDQLDGSIEKLDGNGAKFRIQFSVS